jgi:ParB family chromosome partitioning protein
MRLKNMDGVKTGNLFAIDPQRIAVETGFNVRSLDADHVRSIADAIAAGVRLPPLLVRVKGDMIVLVDGHHRHAAALLALSEGVPVQSLDCVQFSGNEAQAVVAMLASGQAKPHLPLERATAYRRLVGLGWSVVQIAKETGRTDQHVRDLLALATADVEVQDAVREGAVSASAAIQAVRTHKDGAAEVVRAMKGKKSSAREVRQKAAVGRGMIGPLSKDEWRTLARSTGPEGMDLLRRLCAHHGGGLDEIAIERAA